MNKILTDEEKKAVWNTHDWKAGPKDFADKLEAAIIEKLKQQKPAAFMFHIQQKGKRIVFAAIDYETQEGETVIRKIPLVCHSIAEDV